MGSGSSYSGDKAAGAWIWPLTPSFLETRLGKYLDYEKRSKSNLEYYISKNFVICIGWSRRSSMSIVTRLLVGQPRFESRQGHKRILSSPLSPDWLWGQLSFLSSEYRGLSTRVKRPVREANHSSPSRAEVKKCVKLQLPPNKSSWSGA
jgi:hypothetical protein